MKRFLSFLIILFLAWPTHADAFVTATLRDDFNRANENPLSGGGNWLTPLFDAGTAARLDTNEVDGPTNGSAYWAAATFGPDTAVSADLSDGTGSGAVRLYLRVTNPNVAASTDGYFCAFFPDNPLIEIRRVDNSASSSALASTAAFDPADGSKLGCEAIGSTIKAWIDTGSGWTEALSHTDATYGTAGNVGILFTSGNLAIDNFGAQTVGVSTRRPVAPIIFP